eukprot:12770170-Prorocentrum_lima.AAC.1
MGDAMPCGPGTRFGCCCCRRVQRLSQFIRVCTVPIGGTFLWQLLFCLRLSVKGLEHFGCIGFGIVAPGHDFSCFLNNFPPFCSGHWTAASSHIVWVQLARVRKGLEDKDARLEVIVDVVARISNPERKERPMCLP